MSSLGSNILGGLWQHHLLSTSQLRALYGHDRPLNRTRDACVALARSELIRSVRANSRAAEKLWFLTELGGKLAKDILPDRRGKALGLEQAASALQHHTLAVNDVGIAFVSAGRERADECGPSAWTHEVPHRFGYGKQGTLIADAVLHYTIVGKLDRRRYYFIELDRCTEMRSRVVDKLRQYAAYKTHIDSRSDGETAWRELYPIFPRVLLVFAPSASQHAPEVLDRRARTVLEMAAEDPLIQDVLRSEGRFHVTACSLEDLKELGPFAPIFRKIDCPGEKVDLLGGSGRANRPGYLMSG